MADIQNGELKSKDFRRLGAVFRNELLLHVMYMLTGNLLVISGPKRVWCVMQNGRIQGLAFEQSLRPNTCKHFSLVNQDSGTEILKRNVNSFAQRKQSLTIIILVFVESDR